jgi:anti-anti-sigma factor
MEILLNRVTGGVELRLKGRLDGQWSGALDTELQELVRSGERHIQLNLADVVFLSSAGIRVMLKHWKALKAIGGVLGAVELSSVVRETFELSGLSGLVLSTEDTPAAIAAPTMPSVHQIGHLNLRLFPPATGKTLSCRLLGEPGRLPRMDFSKADMHPLPVPRDTLAFGLGALARDFADAQSRFGEFLAVGGAVMHLPADGSNVPDYMLARGEFVPTVQTLYGVVCQGGFSQFAQFEPAEAEAPATGGKATPTGVVLSRLVQTAFEVVQADTLALVLLAETTGLTGASLKSSPVQVAKGSGKDLFEHPEVRRWLAFTPERAYARSLALVAGVATRVENADWAPFVRPLAPQSPIRGHFHAAAFPYRAQSKGLLKLEESVAGLLESESVLGLLHLLHDDRPYSGAGESEFVRGSFWTGPVRL